MSFITGFILPLLLIAMGIRLLLEPISTSYLEFGIAYMAKMRKIDSSEVSLEGNRDAAEALIYYLYLDMKRNRLLCSRRGLARDFNTTVEEIDLIARRMEWQFHAYQNLADDYQNFLVERAEAEKRGRHRKAN